MKSTKFLAVAVCGMTVMALGQGVSAAEPEKSSANEVPVSYNYTSAADPVSPNYLVDIPTGVTFSATNPTFTVDTTVSMSPAQGETEITGDCSAKVEVKSAGEYKVALADGTDGVAYELKYGTITLSGATATTIGTLKKTTAGTDDVLELTGTAKLKGVATKTGNHVDTLTYTITNVTI